MRTRLALAAAVAASSAWLVPPSHALPCGPENEPICTVIVTACQKVLVKNDTAYRLVCTLG